MKVVKMLVLSGLAAVMCCFAVAGSAWATPGPLWGFCSDAGGGENAHCTGAGSGYEAKLLQAGETLLALGLSLGTQVLLSTVSAQTIQCSALHAHGYLEGGDPGKDNEILVYTGCSVPSASGCSVFSVGASAGTIETEDLISELVYLSQEAAEALNAGGTGTLFKPASGSTFTELELTGTGCPITTPPAAKIKGEVITENLNATNRELLHTLIAPTTAKTSYWLDTSPAKEDKITRINLAGHNATYLGEVSVDVSLLGHFGDWLAYWVCP